MISDTSRSYGIHLYTPRATDYRIEIEREVVRTYENGDVARVGQRLVYRKLSAIAADNVPGGPVTITTYAELATLIAACAAALAAEDEANIPPIPETSDP